MGIMVVHGARAGGFSPISIYGSITNDIVEKSELPGSPLTLRGHGHVGLVAEPLDRRGLSTCLKHRSGGVENGDRCDRRRECAGHHSGVARHVEDPV